MGSSPSLPCYHKGWLDAVLLEPLRYSANFLDRPADERARVLRMGILVFLVSVGLPDA